MAYELFSKNTNISASLGLYTTRVLRENKCVMLADIKGKELHRCRVDFTHRNSSKLREDEKNKWVSMYVRERSPQISGDLTMVMLFSETI